MLELPSDNVIEHPVLVTIDPGGVTGWSVFVVHRDCLEDPEFNLLGYNPKNIKEKGISHWSCGNIVAGDISDKSVKGKVRGGVDTFGESRCVKEILKMVSMWPRCAVLIEDFILDYRTHSTNRELLSPARITAGIDYGLYCMKPKKHSFRLRNVDTFPTITDERLRDWGFYGEKRNWYRGEDAKSAVKHAIMFLRKCKELGDNARLRKELAWPHIYGQKEEKEE